MLFFQVPFVYHRFEATISINNYDNYMYNPFKWFVLTVHDVYMTLINNLA